MRNLGLTLFAAPAKKRAMKNLLLIVAASAALVACEKETIDQGGKEREIAAANAAKVVLPPSIRASKSYRCKDNSVVYIDWLSDGSARVKADKAAQATPIKVGQPGTPSLKGDATAATITYNGQSCKA
jgi:hypothetical protein